MPTYSSQSYYGTAPDVGAVESGPPIAPTNITSPVISPTSGFVVGTVLSTTNGTWNNSPTSYTYQWTRNGSSISGATSSSYTLVTGDAGTSISVSVTATNVTGSNSAGASPVTIPAAPSNTVTPAVTGNNVVGSVLTSTNGTWINSPTSYTYQWKRSSATISGATSSTYTIVTGDLGTNLTVDVVAINSFGSSSAVTSNAITVPGSAYGQGAALLGIDILEHPHIAEIAGLGSWGILRPLYFPLHPEGLLVMQLQALRCQVRGVGSGSETGSMAIYTFNYSALNTFSATLIAATGTFSMLSTGLKTVDLTGAPISLDFTQNRYLIGMNTDTFTGILGGASPAATGLGILRANLARSTTTDWPASFNQTAVSGYTAYPYIAAVTAYGKFYL